MPSALNEAHSKPIFACRRSWRSTLHVPSSEKGAKAGYEALDRAADCTIRVQSFTPLRIIKRVPIVMRDGGQYTIKIVEIRTADGAREYLITTREVRE